MGIVSEILKFLNLVLGIFLKYPWQVLFGISIVVIFFMQTCKVPCTEIIPCPENDTVWIKGDSIPYPDTTYIPVHHYSDTGSTHFVEIPANIDSLAVAIAYFDILNITDTILYDTNGTVIIYDIISMNRIQSRVVKKVFYPSYVVVTETYTIPEKPRNLFYLGAGVGGWNDHFGVSLMASLVNKKKQIWGISYDPLNKDFRVSLQLPIRFRKH